MSNPTRVLDHVNQRRAELAERRHALDEIGLQDIAIEAAMLEELRVLHAIAIAYWRELNSQWRLPHNELRAALHRAFAAVEEDDANGVIRALFEAADLVRGRGS